MVSKIKANRETVVPLMNQKAFFTSVILSRPKGVSKNLCCIPKGDGRETRYEMSHRLGRLHTRLTDKPC